MVTRRKTQAFCKCSEDEKDGRIRHWKAQEFPGGLQPQREESLWEGRNANFPQQLRGSGIKAAKSTRLRASDTLLFLCKRGNLPRNSEPCTRARSIRPEPARLLPPAFFPPVSLEAQTLPSRSPKAKAKLSQPGLSKSVKKLNRRRRKPTFRDENSDRSILLVPPGTSRSE